MRGLVANRFVLLGLVLLALAATGAVAWVTGPTAVGAAPAAGQPQLAPVISAIRACPAPGTGRVAVFAASAGDTGRAQLIPAPAAGAAAAAPRAITTQSDRLWLSRIHLPAAPRKQPTAVIVDAAGAIAQGLDVEQTSYPPVGSAGHVDGVQCSQPGTDFWFLGPGPASSANLKMYLVNPDNRAAAADVEIFTDTGPLQGNTDTGIAVPPGGSVVQSIRTFIKGARVVSLHVRTSVGRIAAAVREAGVWWRAASAPATQVVIPGLPGSGTGRRLYLVDPGGNDAQVHVRAVTPAGSYEPAGAGGIAVPAGSVISLDLPSLNGIPAGLRLTSAVPVTAAMLVGDRAFAAAAPPIDQQGVVADNVAGKGIRASVVLSAPAAAARVRITAVGPSGPLGAARLVSIRARHSADIKLVVPRLARGLRHGFAIVISPLRGSGPVFAGRVLTARPRGSVELITPVLSAPMSVALPPISAAPGGAIG